MELIVAAVLLALLSAALIAPQRGVDRSRPNRGELGQSIPGSGFFKDLWGRATGGIESIASFVGSLIETVLTLVTIITDLVGAGVGATLGNLQSAFALIWEAIVNFAVGLFARVEDAAALIWGVIANLGAGLFSRIEDGASLLWGVIANFASGIFSRFEDGVSLIWGALANFAAGLFSRVQDLGTLLWGVIANGFAGLFSRMEDAAATLTEIPIAIKDAAEKTVETAVDGLMGAPDAIDDMWEANLALVRAFLAGDMDSVDDVVGLILGKKKLPGPLWDLITFPLLLAALASALSAMGGVAAEGVVQDFRRRNPKALFDPQDLRDAVLRKKVSEGDARDQLQSAGFSAERAQVLMDLWHDIPPPADLIRMAVREAFSPDVVARFGQNQDFPPRFGELAEQQGISEEFALAYWAAHWDLPSPQQGFEMFHRGVIDFDTLQLLLRALDVMPFWRDKLTDIAYNVVGRIDTRRLFQMGIWDRARVERSYLDQGYPPQEAADLTNWTVLEYSTDGGGTRDLTRAAIEQAFKQGRLDRGGAVFALVSLGYSEDEADFLITNVEVNLLNAASEAAENSIREVTQTTVLRAYRERIIPRGEAESMLAELGYTADGISLLIAVQDFTNENELATLRAKIVEQEFRHGTIGGDVARSRLAGAGIEGERADLIVQRWEIQFGAKDKDLTEAQLRAALRGNIIDDVTYVLRVVALGYSLDDASILLQLAGGANTTAMRELTAAQIVDAYKRTLTSRATAAERLIAAGFDAADAELQLKIADQDLARAAEVNAQRAAAAAAAQIKDLARTSIEGAYKRGVIDRAAAKARLVELGFADGDAELLLQIVDVDIASVLAERAQREAEAAAAEVRELARTSIEGAYKRSIIDRANAKAQLVGLGYTDADAELLLVVVDFDLANAAAP